MTAFDASWLTVAMVAYAAASSAFVGYRLGPMVRKWKKGH